MLYGISFIFIIFLQVEDSRNKSQIEQGYEINNDSQSDIAYFLMLIVMT